jgi:hypothetical protein
MGSDGSLSASEEEMWNVEGPSVHGNPFLQEVSEKWPILITIEF